MHTQLRTVSTPMKDMQYDQLNPGNAALAELQANMR
jgi:hypothetical protein